MARVASDHLYEYWLENGHSHRLRFMLGEHQTPEYRIAEDARVATDLPIDLSLGLLSSFLSAITFIGVLWTVGGDFVIEAFGVFLSVPGYLVIAVVVYSMVFTTSMMLIGRHLTRVSEEYKRAEAELRTTLASQTNSLLTPIIALLLCMPKYLVGTMTLGEVVQAAAAFAIVQSAFNWITDNYGRLAEWTSSANRVASLLLALDQIDPAERSTNRGMIAGITGGEFTGQTRAVTPD